LNSPLRIETSYRLRGERITQSDSLPRLTVKNLTEMLKHIAWIAEQDAPRVQIYEGKLYNS